jgi:hypothetical protein
VTWLWAWRSENRGLMMLAWIENFLFLTAFELALGPTQLWPNEYRGLFPWGKLAGTRGWHSSPSSEEVRSDWNWSSALPHILMGWRLIKHRENFIYTLVYLHTTWGFHGEDSYCDLSFDSVVRWVVRTFRRNILLPFSGQKSEPGTLYLLLWGFRILLNP